MSLTFAQAALPTEMTVNLPSERSSACLLQRLTQPGLAKLPRGDPYSLEPDGTSNLCRYDKIDLLGYSEGKGLEEEDRCHPTEERGR